MLNRRFILGLQQVVGIGAKSVRHVVDAVTWPVRDVCDLRDALLKVRDSVPRIAIPDKMELEQALDTADRLVDSCLAKGIHVLTLGDPDFPTRMCSIPDPPSILFVKGNVGALTSELAVAIVGTREPTEYGHETGVRIAKTCSRAGFVVVSGLAKGCDAAAHAGCIEAEGKTVAVLANGVDIIYPAENRSLAEAILAKNGCLVSEYEPGTRAQPSFFVRRDRLQSGLTLGVIIIETGIKGGTMHTVGFAEKQGRLLACVEHPARYDREPKVQGNIQLVRDGRAVPLRNGTDLEAFVERLRSFAVQRETVQLETDSSVPAAKEPITSDVGNPEQAPLESPTLVAPIIDPRRQSRKKHKKSDGQRALF